MPSIKSIADVLNLTLPTIERNKWDRVGLAQLYPDYEIVKQFVQAARKSEDVSHTIERKLEIGSPSSFEASYVNHPAQTHAPVLSKTISTPLVKVRTSMTYAEDEKALQGKSQEKLVDIVQMRTIKWQAELWEGLEHAILASPTSPNHHPDVLRGLRYWVTADATLTAKGLRMNGGDDPAGFPTGAGGILKAEEPRWPNAYGRFNKISQDDFFDTLSQFLNRVRLQSVVPHPSLVTEIPSRVCYVQEPVKRACERYFSVSNEQIGNDGGVYRGANFFRDIPITIWHAMSEPNSPVQDPIGTVRLIDWNSFELIFHSAFDQKITGPLMLPDVPDQMVCYNTSWLALHCNRRDRNLLMQTSTPELQPLAD